MNQNGARDLVSFYQAWGHVVFVPVVAGGKECYEKGWSSLTYEQTLAPEYQQKLSHGNLGILTGPSSENLVGVDLDSQLAVDLWLEANGWCNGTRQVKTHKGRRFYFHISGRYPARSVKFGERLGEWHGKSLSVIDGPHPDGGHYFCIPNPILEVPFERFAWPGKFKRPEIEGEEAEIVLPDPIEYRDFLAQSLQKPRPIIHNLLDASSRLILGGGSKTYKTWLMSDMALSIVAGSQWLGFTTMPCKVIYVNFELKEYYARLRFEAIASAKSIVVPKDQLFLWNLRGHNPTVAEFKATLINLIRNHGAVVVFVDPFYRLLPHGADERVSADLMEVLLMFEQINVETLAAIVCAAHFTKGSQAGKESVDRISGGAGMSRQPDNLITLTNHKQPGAFALEFTLRDFPPIDPFVISWTHPLLVPATELSPKDLKTPKPNKAEFFVEDLLEVIAQYDDQFALVKELKTLVQDQTGMSNGTFYQLWKAASKKLFKSKLSGNWNLKP